MSTLLSTLPGDIPGLLGRGSPVCYHSRRRDETLTDVVSRIDEGYAYGPDQACADVALDLSDPTGRVHAAWWIRGKSTEGSAIWASIGREDWYLTDLAERNAPMTPEQIGTLARLVLRLAGRAS